MQFGKKIQMLLSIMFEVVYVINKINFVNVKKFKLFYVGYFSKIFPCLWTFLYLKYIHMLLTQIPKFNDFSFDRKIYIFICFPFTLKERCVRESRIKSGSQMKPNISVLTQFKQLSSG